MVSFRGYGFTAISSFFVGSYACPLYIGKTWITAMGIAAACWYQPQLPQLAEMVRFGMFLVHILYILHSNSVLFAQTLWQIRFVDYYQ